MQVHRDGSPFTHNDYTEIQLIMTQHIISLLLVFSSISSIYSQNRVIQGKVIDDWDLEPLMGVGIILNDSIQIGATGADGCFQFETPLPVNKLSFRYVGMEDANLQLSDNCNHIELIMQSSRTYCFMPLRKVKKEKRKSHKKHQKLYKKAFDKGIFQSAEVCYIQEFTELKCERGIPR